MKLGQVVQDYATNVETHGKFRVANNSVMQQILSNFLYSDKVKAVIRELSTNAFESHYDAGCPDKQFYVQLPTRDNPQFSIRDYGVGLPKDKLQELYCVYGLSTKRQSNEYTGCLGIGSKSFFAYADMAYVISYYNGMKYTVVNSKNARGEFVYDIISEVETDEPNGLEVTFDVNKNDVHDFVQKATEVYRWFKVPPKTNINLTFNKPKYIESGPGWDLVNYSNYYSNKNYVIMGQVAYELDGDVFTGYYKTILDNCNIHLHVGIGEISITPSRESIQQDRLTIEKIQSILDNFYNYTKAKAEKAIANCKSVWEARILSREFFENNQYYSSILSNKITFDGSFILNISHLKTQNLGLFKYSWYASDKKVIESKKGKGRYSSGIKVEVSPKAKFAVYEQGGYSAARRYVEANQDVVLYVIPPDKKDELVKITGILESDLLYTSSFPPAIRQAKAKSVNNIIQAYRPRGITYNYAEARAYWDNDSIDLDNESGYYFPMKEFYCNGISFSRIKDYVSGNIIGILENRVARVKNHKNWKHVRELINDKILGLLNQLKYSEIPEISSEIKKLATVRDKIKGKLHAELCKVHKLSSEEGVLNKFKELNSIYIGLGGKTHTLTLPKGSYDIDLSVYPMLEFVDHYNITNQKVLDYINSLGD